MINLTSPAYRDVLDKVLFLAAKQYETELFNLPLSDVVPEKIQNQEEMQWLKKKKEEGRLRENMLLTLILSMAASGVFPIVSICMII